MTPARAHAVPRPKAADATVGRFQCVLMLVCGLTYMADAMEIMLISYLSTLLEAAWSLNAIAQATLASTARRPCTRTASLAVHSSR